MKPNQELTSLEFKTIHHIVDEIMRKRREEQTPLLRKDVIKSEVETMFSQQGIDLDAVELKNQLIHISEQNNHTWKRLFPEDVNNLLGSQDEQELQFKEQHLKNESDKNVFGFLKIPTHYKTLKMLIKGNQLYRFVGNKGIYQSIAYYYSMLEISSMKKMIKRKVLLDQIPLFFVTLLFNYIVWQFVNPALNLLPIYVFIAIFTWVSGTWFITSKTIKQKLISEINWFGSEEKDKIIKDEEFKCALMELGLDKLNVNDACPLTKEVKEFIERLSKIPLGLVILNNYKKNKGAFTVLDLGLLGAAFYECIPYKPD